MSNDMYVFYDKKGDIRAIAPSVNDFNAEDCSYVIFPLAEVEPFLSGKISTSDYEVRKVKSSENKKFILSKKVTNVISYTRTLDTYLTEISTKEASTTFITITNYTNTDSIIVDISPDFRILYETGSEEEIEIIDDILKLNYLSVYVTEKNNPYHLLVSLIFSPKELFEHERLYFTHEGKVENASAYTKKIINGYCYKEV